MSECDTCIHNRGAYCDADQCSGGDGYEDNRIYPCPVCGGRLSTIRTDGVERWRHCYSCHFEFQINEGSEPIRRKVSE